MISLKLDHETSNKACTNDLLQQPTNSTVRRKWSLRQANVRSVHFYRDHSYGPVNITLYYHTHTCVVQSQQ